MKLIPVSPNKYAKVDDEDYEELKAKKWRLAGMGYAARSAHSILMHREIMNAPEGTEVDHIDHDKLNNCKSNLRVCTTHQNRGNITIGIKNTSGFKGVFYYQPTDKWRACISHKQKCITLGYYLTPEDAARAYDKAATEYFGEFALTNFKMRLL